MNSSPTIWIKKHQLISFFVLTYLITFVVGFGYVILRPSEPLHPWSLVWFFEVFGPTFSALIVTGICSGKPGIKHLLAGLTRWKVGFFWYFAAAFLFLAPLMITLIYKALGNPSPGIRPGETFASLFGIVVFTLFSGPIAEELGWRGFALPRLQARFNALLSSLILGVIWVLLASTFILYHGLVSNGHPVSNLLDAGDYRHNLPDLVVHNTGGSLIITILAHFSYNLTGFLTGPLGLMPGMQFNMIAGALLGILTIGIVIVYGPRYLSRKQIADLPFQPLPEPTTVQLPVTIKSN